MMELLDRLHRKDEVTYALLWIGAYVVLASVADGISVDLGTPKLVTAPVLVLLSALLWCWVSHAGLREEYGLRSPQVPAARLLWYVPLVLVATKKVWLGLQPNGTPVEGICYVTSMCCVGFLEELVFRGLLFRGMEKDGRTRAIVVSSVTFGIGHVVNLFNASGQGLALTLVQMAFAVSVGFMLVLTLLKGGSLWPCVIFHAVNNALSFFEDETVQAIFFGTAERAMAVALVTSLAIAGFYCLYLLRRPDVA